MRKSSATSSGKPDAKGRSQTPSPEPRTGAAKEAPALTSLLKILSTMSEKEFLENARAGIEAAEESRLFGAKLRAEREAKGKPLEYGKDEADLSTLLKWQATECTSKIAEKWTSYIDVLKFTSDVSLAEQIDSFAIPVQEYVENYYPLLVSGPLNIFWMMIFSAILETKTHSVEEVNEAMADLDKKYGSDGA